MHEGRSRRKSEMAAYQVTMNTPFSAVPNAPILAMRFQSKASAQENTL
jgi:hypothetical protein